MSSDERPPHGPDAEALRLRAVALNDQMAATWQAAKPLPPGPARHALFERWCRLRRQLWVAEDTRFELLGHTPEEVRVLARHDLRAF